MEVLPYYGCSVKRPSIIVAKNPGRTEDRRASSVQTGPHAAVQGFSLLLREGNKESSQNP